MAKAKRKVHLTWNYDGTLNVKATWGAEDKGIPLTELCKEAMTSLMIFIFNMRMSNGKSEEEIRPVLEQGLELIKEL